MTESESLVFGTDFGIVTDIETGPHANLFVASLDRGALYEVATGNARLSAAWRPRNPGMPT